MKKIVSIFLFCFYIHAIACAQDETEEEKKGFQKENLFTGGSVSFSIGDRFFLVGGSPVLGYSLAKWVDLGIVANYIYSSQREYYAYNDKLRQAVYGGGVFTRLFPVRFLFAQAQLEHNWIKVKYIPPNGGLPDENTVSAASLLIGPGYTTGRDPNSKSAFGYFAVLFDVLQNQNSPYTNSAGRATPIFRGGINIPLFQGKQDR